MAPKLNLNAGTKKKAGKEPAAKELVGKELPAPTTFVTRPFSEQLATKHTALVFLLAASQQRRELPVGTIVSVHKDGYDSSTGFAAVVQVRLLLEDDELPVVELSRPLRRLAGLVLGDRVALSVLPTPAVAAEVTVGMFPEEEATDKHRTKASKMLQEIALVLVGLEVEVAVGESTVRAVVALTDASLEQLVSKLSLGPGEPPQSASLCRLVNAATAIEFGSATPNLSLHPWLSQRVLYDTVGGLHKQIEVLRSTIDIPLHHPEVFAQFGISPPRGVLLYGPPGTGKTMLLRSVAFEADAHVVRIDGPSVVSKYLGETEQAIRAVFAEARRFQPLVVFIDEIDSLAPSRNSDDSGEVESRVVATLLMLMDGMGDGGRVCVVAATNRPNAIDPALRRPGRFDQEVEVGVPDMAARGDILRKQLAKMDTDRHELSSDDLELVASRTHGYVGADLVALVRELVMRCVKRSFKEPQLGWRVQMVDVEQALLEIQPLVMREIFLEMPPVHWDDIGGQHQLKRKLKEMVQMPLEAAPLFARLGIKAPKGLLLYGPPGCSKTLTAKALATESGINFLAVKGPEIFNKYVGELERAIREVFRKARAALPAIVFLDEVDAIATVRDGEGTAAGANVLTLLLNEIDGVEELAGVVVVAATNRPDLIDPALLRPGRLDRHLYVGPPDYDARLHILKRGLRQFGVGEEALGDFASRTEGCSGAEVALLVQEAGLAALMEDVEVTRVEIRHFEQALLELLRGITPDMLEYYEEFALRSGGCIDK